MSSPLLLHPRPADADGTVHRVTPESAGRRFVGFEVIDLAVGQAFSRTETGRELCLVPVPRGFHPVCAPYGFDLYYLNMMAGPVRQWKFTMDREQAHLPY